MRKKKKKNLCNHDLNSENSTVTIVSRRIMVHPETIDGFCTVCHDTFRYVKNGKDIALLEEASS